MDMTNTYWNENGKYQQEYDKLSKLMPDFEYTDNKYINLLIAISNIYYRIYNDGDSFTDFDNNIRYIKPFENDINFESYHNYQEQELEELVNRVINFIKDKDLNYTEYVIYFNYDKQELSKNSCEGFKKIVSGTESYLNDWINSFVNCGFKFV